MGDNIKTVVSNDNKRLLSKRLALDLSENIHLHYRDLRLEFSVEEMKIKQILLT